MNSIHDSPPKRTSINELLNPVANSAPQSLDTTSYSSGQGNGHTSRQWLSHDHQPPGSDRGPFHQVMNVPGGSFSLRAASWDQQNGIQVNSRRDQEAEYSSACQYTSSPPHAYHSSDTEYPDSYIRPRPNGEHTNGSMDAPSASSSWSHSSSHEPSSSSSYSSSVQVPMYSNERTAIAEKPPSKEFPAPQAPSSPSTQQAQHQPAPHQAQSAPYRHDVAHQGYNGNGYIPVVFARAPPMHPGMAPHPPPTGVPVPSAPMYMHPGVVPYPPYPYYVQQPPAPTPAKRPLETDDGVAGSRPKKAKSKPVSSSEANSNGVSKRKKRNEAVPGSPFNPQAMAEISKEKGKGRVSPTPPVSVLKVVVPAPIPMERPGAKYDPELQSARCMSNRYKSSDFPRCVSCTRRWAGDTCRFQGVRYFLKDQFGHMRGISFVEIPQEDPILRFPDKWNIHFGHYYINRIKRIVAEALLPILKEEQEHQKHTGVVRRPRETDVRATCDTCMTSLFACTWMCRQCGREACKDCYNKIVQLTVPAPDAGPAEVVGLQAKKERHAHQNPFFLACNRRSEHIAGDFNRVSRFSDEDLSATVEAMETYLATPEKYLTPPPVCPKNVNGQANELSDTPSQDSSQSHVIAGAAAGTNPALLPGLRPSTTSTSPPTHLVRQFSNSEFNDSVFHDNWIKGEPLVVTGTLSNFQIRWSPEYLSEQYGTQEVVLLDCQGDGNKRQSVAEFFSEFGKYENRKEIWKLKDWPPTQDFKNAFPDLYNDFANGTPVPNYIRRDGVLNLASHFPTNTVAPDMGPKMYNAMASSERVGSKGTTRLHMDASDAVNIMMYATDTPEGSPGCAVWDLYRPEDTIKLKKFLRKKCKSQLGPNHQRDPIHSQQCFLDCQLRQELYDETGVMSYRIIQYPGDAVFIPAGYTHQVCNLADCIKVATDFVSPENIARCEALTKEFRDQNQSGAWKEDILQLRTMMWFAWQSCLIQEKELKELER